MDFVSVVAAALLTNVILIGALAFLSGNWIRARIRESIRAEYNERLEDYRYGIRVREQAAKTAEYLSLAWRLAPDDDKETYRRVNQLGWELAIWLPADAYRAMVEGIANPNEKNNVMATIISIRKLLLENPGDLAEKNIAFHVPNAGATEYPAGQPKDSNPTT